MRDRFIVGAGPFARTPRAERYSATPRILDAAIAHRDPGRRCAPARGVSGRISERSISRRDAIGAATHAGDAVDRFVEGALEPDHDLLREPGVAVAVAMPGARRRQRMRRGSMDRLRPREARGAVREAKGRRPSSGRSAA